MNGKVDPDRLEDLRSALLKLDPERRKSWILEIYDLRNGRNVLSQEINIKTGKTRTPKQRAEAEK